MNRLAFALLTGCCVSIFAQDDPSKTKEAPEAIIAREAAKLKRVPPLSPTDSLKRLQLHSGFSAQLVAAEPFVRDPVAIDFDESGRMYVVQLPPYNAYALKDFKHKGSIQVLEDSDGDGRVDRSSTFASNLNYPTAVFCWDGGIFVGDSPDILYLKDTTGDGKADVKRAVFSGFGKDKAGESHLNSFRWGLDNRIHISTNLSGGNVKVVGSDKAPVSVRGRGFLFDPREVTHPQKNADGSLKLPTFELTSGGGQHGMSMDDWGRKFVCSNSVPAQTLMYDDRYVARNPLLPAPRTAVDIAPQGKFTELYRISPPEPWRALRTSLRKAGTFRGSDEGGKPFGFFTGATGITIYRGDIWPRSTWGCLLVGDVANNLIYRANLESDGLDLIARRALPNAVNANGPGKSSDSETEAKPSEFVASSDIWFRPVQMANAPDGSLYVLDMSRELIEGAAFLPIEFMKHLDPVGGHDRGRIYRIVPTEFTTRANQGDIRRDKPHQVDGATYHMTRLNGLATTTLARLINHDNGWHRDTASRLLYQRQDQAAVPILRELSHSARESIVRATALSCLDGLDALEAQDVLRGLSDDVLVRAHAIRLSEKHTESIEIRERLLQLADDPNLDVVYQVAFSLGSISHPRRNPKLVSIVRRHGKNRWIRLAVQSSLASGADQVFESLVADKDFRATTHGVQFLNSLAAQIGLAKRVDQQSRAMKALLASGISDSKAASLLRALFHKSSLELQNRVLKGSQQANQFIEDAIKAAKKQALDKDAPEANRLESIRTLSLAQFDDVARIAEQLLEPQQPAEIQHEVIKLVSGFREPAVAKLLLETWSTATPQQRSRIAETMFSRASWTSAFLDAVAQKEIDVREIDRSRVVILKKHPSPSIRNRVARLFKQSTSSRAKTVEKYTAALMLDGNLDNGRKVFRKNCASCHRLEDHGKSIGADLKGITTRGAQAVLLNILDPNREVKPKYLVYNLVTTDGRIVNGMITSENANSVTIQRPDGTSVTTLRESIETLRSTGLSFMPEGLEKEINVQGMADLIRYLSAN